jgi:hypothetical protein
MADRGFTIADLLHRSKRCRSQHSTHETKTMHSSQKNELVETRRIASVRIHVEWAIGRLKHYHILNNLPNCMHIGSLKPLAIYMIIYVVCLYAYT